MKIVVITAIAAAIIITALYLSNASAETWHLKIGVVAPLSGSDSIWGERMRDGISLMQNKNVTFFFEDGKCDPKEAVSAVEKLMQIDKVDAIIGEACSSATLAIAPIAQKEGKILISPSSTDPRIPNIGSMIFRNWYSNDIEMKKMSQVIKELGYNKTGILYTLNEWGENRKNTFKSNFNGTVVEEGHEKGSADLRTQLLKIKNSGADAILLIQYTSDMVLTLRQMKELNMTFPIFATTTVEDPTFLQLSGNLSDGIIYVSPDIKISDSFRQKYISAYGREPHQTAATSYDAAELIYSAFINAGPDSKMVSMYLIGLKNYSGASGIYSFNPDRDVERPAMIRIIKNQTAFEFLPIYLASHN